VEISESVDVVLKPYRVVYSALVAKIDDVEREPPVFTMRTLEMESAGAYIEDNMQILVVDRATVFKVDVRRGLSTLRADETNKEAFGPAKSCAAENPITFVVIRLALTLDVVVMNVLALVKH